VAAPLRVGGLTPLSTTDYPGQLAAVVFCQGCPWRCAYCHNPHLLSRRGATEIAWTDVVAFLERRRGLLDAVVFSGGEPTLQRRLGAAMREARALGFKIGLHTAGIVPARLKKVLPLLDWVGMDVKAPFEDYQRITGVAGSGARASASAQLIVASGVDCEFRTTVHDALLTREAVAKIAATLSAMGANRYALQAFRAEGCAAPALTATPQASRLDPAFRDELALRFNTLILRDA
jgi:pyruvate formate lyase activating enzyme